MRARYYNLDYSDCYGVSCVFKESYFISSNLLRSLEDHNYIEYNLDITLACVFILKLRLWELF